MRTDVRKLQDFSSTTRFRLLGSRILVANIKASGSLFPPFLASLLGSFLETYRRIS